MYTIPNFLSRYGTKKIKDNIHTTNMYTMKIIIRKN